MDTRPIAQPKAQIGKAASSGSKAETVKSPALNRVRDGVEAPAGQVNSEQKDWDVQISPEAVDRAEARRKAMNAAKQTSPIREDRVADLKKRIADGTYKLDSGKIADGMLTEAIKDHVASNPDELWDRE